MRPWAPAGASRLHGAPRTRPKGCPPPTTTTKTVSRIAFAHSTKGSLCFPDIPFYGPAATRKCLPAAGAAQARALKDMAISCARTCNPWLKVHMLFGPTCPPQNTPAAPARTAGRSGTAPATPPPPGFSSATNTPSRRTSYSDLGDRHTSDDGKVRSGVNFASVRLACVPAGEQGLVSVRSSQWRLCLGLLLSQRFVPAMGLWSDSREHE